MVGVTDIGGTVDLDAESDTLPVDVVVLLLLAVTDGNVLEEVVPDDDVAGVRLREDVLLLDADTDADAEGDCDREDDTDLLGDMVSELDRDSDGDSDGVTDAGLADNEVVTDLEILLLPVDDFVSDGVNDVDFETEMLGVAEN